METRAHYTIIGGFVVFFLVALFTFIYWLQNAGGLVKQTEYRIQFNEPAIGLTNGAPVLFNGIRVGSITALHLNKDQPQRVTVTIAVDPNTPVRSDTQAGITNIGLTGAPAISLKGGTAQAPAVAAADGRPALLVAAGGASQTLTESARDTLNRLDKVIDDNSAPLNQAITGIANFAGALSRNSDKVDGILAGLEKMLGGGDKAQPKATYDLEAAKDFPELKKSIDGQVVVSDPTSILAFDTQKVLVRTAQDTLSSLENAEWADNLPKLFQAKVVQSFENAKQLNNVSRPLDQLNAGYKLELNIRHFEIKLAPSPAALVEFSARILAENGEVKEARLFSVSSPTDGAQAPTAVRALNQAFLKAAQELVVWTVNAI
jgi:phospholipid/cholesterol/gamma-HCH transport system substrate-binding protein